jgi:hypothetical protein
MTARAILLPVWMFVTFALCGAEPLGTVNQVGTTWSDQQQLGSSGRMIASDASGNVHAVWTNGLSQSPTSHHVFYNVWDPATEAFIWDGGMQMDAGVRAGYATGAISPDGRGYCAFNGPETAMTGLDFLPRSGSFICSPIAEDADQNLFYPKAVMGHDGKLHVLATSNNYFQPAQYRSTLFYARGVPVIGEGGIASGINWENVSGEEMLLPLDTLRVPAYEIVASPNSDRIAAIWVHSRPNDSTLIPWRDNDLHYRSSLDGGVTWSDIINVTDFNHEGTGGSTGHLDEDADSFRVCADISALFDENDRLHIAFTTKMFYAAGDSTSRYASQIWHWDETNHLYTPIRAIDESYRTANWAEELGEWEAVAQQPSLSYDPVSGSLFCSYQFSDTLQWSDQGIPQADAWVSRSDDGGLHWSTGTNVTNTDGGQNTVAGECQHERDISLSPYISWEDGTGYLTMQYVLDRDAGCCVGPNPVGVATSNTVNFQRIPMDEIPAEPYVDWCSPQLRSDGTGSPCSEAVRDITQYHHWDYALGPNFPNPFNPSTTIQFDLAKPMTVSLTVHDMLGRQVAQLINGEQMNAGTHDVTSGVYFYRLQAEGRALTNKMLLMK